MKETYREIEITYIEADNKWQFTVNGRQRSTESLVKARESIDRALDTMKKDKPAWKPFNAYLPPSYGETDYKVVKVTSVAEKDRYSSRTEVWISEGGRRSKRSTRDVYAISPENDAAIAEIKSLKEQYDKIDEQLREAKAKLVNIETPSEEE